MSDLIDFALREGYPDLFAFIQQAVNAGNSPADVEIAVTLRGYGELVCIAARHEAETLITQRDEAAKAGLATPHAPEPIADDGADPCLTCARTDCMGSRCPDMKAQGAA
jgi:hypothetical protein